MSKIYELIIYLDACENDRDCDDDLDVPSETGEFNKI